MRLSAHPTILRGKRRRVGCGDEGTASFAIDAVRTSSHPIFPALNKLCAGQRFHALAKVSVWLQLAWLALATISQSGKSAAVLSKLASASRTASDDSKAMLLLLSRAQHPLNRNRSPARCMRKNSAIP
jgi:hypothetical protein